MGIAGLVPWLRRKYPVVTTNVIEDGQNPIKPNPNYQEFDNMYIDMNGIIHQCAHPEGRTTPITEEEIFELIFDHVDRLFAIVRPRKLLYFAIDGVAPRAKMNQQRSRRFQSSKEAMKKRKELAVIRNRLSNQGVQLPPKHSSFDSNQITPGTAFMVRLAAAFRYFIHLRVTAHPAWQKLVIVLSDASVPGEGEHKIIDFIRRQQKSPNYNPNISHCIAGPDADLIMLGLATHEANFVILRQEFDMSRPMPCEICSRYGHKAKDCSGFSISNDSNIVAKPTTYIFVRLPELRKYLYHELEMPNLPIKYDCKRAIDDWVFLCFFIGNDFLPHLPSLDIYENAVDRLITIYKDVVCRTGGWLTENGDVELDRVELIMMELAKAESEIFRTRQERDLNYSGNRAQRRQSDVKESALVPQSKPAVTSSVTDENVPRVRSANQRRSGSHAEQPCIDDFFESKDTVSGKKRSFVGDGTYQFRPKALKTSNLENSESRLEVTRESVNSTVNTTLGTENVDENNKLDDSIRFWEDGWKNRYYMKKFGVSETDIDFRRKVAWAYTEGLCWVFKYYRQGCPSWDWYYPYHYAPFASDFDTISKFNADWSKPTKPFFPLDQQMAIFPSASRFHVPEAWRDFMTSPDSPIYHFYPSEFEVDSEGKKFPGNGIALLPFVDENLLLNTLKTAYDSLTAEERARNIVGFERIFVGRRHQMFKILEEIYVTGKKRSNEVDDQGKPLEPEWVSVEPAEGHGLAGDVCYDSLACDVGAVYNTVFSAVTKYKNIQINTCMMLAYRNLTKADVSSTVTH